MRKIMTILTACLVSAALLTGCAAKSAGTGKSEETAATTAAETTPAVTTAAPEPVELTVFAAASMTETLNQIAEMYKEEAPNVTLTFNFDSSGTLKTQIQEGAVCDIFVSAAQKQMDQLDISADPAANTEKLDFVLSDTRVNLLGNSCVLIVPQGNPAGIKGFDDVGTDRVKLIALGNSDVPVGQYSQEIFTTLGTWDKLNADGKITFGTNVKEVLAQVASASVDCGVVYSTDAATATGIEVVCAAPEGSHKAITYPAAVLKTSQNQEAAKAFLTYLRSEACGKVFESVGFTVLG